MRNISFAMTTPQIKARTKTVTRRWGWISLKAGTLLQGVEKSQGLKKGEKIVKLVVIRVLKVNRVPLESITRADCVREGFPLLSPADFVAMLLKGTKKTAQDLITRIEFEYIEGVL